VLGDLHAASGKSILIASRTDSGDGWFGRRILNQNGNILNAAAKFLGSEASASSTTLVKCPRFIHHHGDLPIQSFASYARASSRV
jgi:hypothetical protein